MFGCLWLPLEAFPRRSKQGNRMLPYRLPQGGRSYSCPLPLTLAYRLEGATLANRLAANRNYRHSCIMVWPTTSSYMTDGILT